MASHSSVARGQSPRHHHRTAKNVSSCRHGLETVLGHTVVADQNPPRERVREPLNVQTEVVVPAANRGWISSTDGATHPAVQDDPSVVAGVGIGDAAAMEDSGFASRSLTLALGDATAAEKTGTVEDDPALQKSYRSLTYPFGLVAGNFADC